MVSPGVNCGMVRHLSSEVIDFKMPDCVIDTSKAPALSVAEGTALFPVRRVFCIGPNYAAHAIEMGHEPDREAPFLFQKKPDNRDPRGAFASPAQPSDAHHDAEPAVLLRSGGADIPVSGALDHFFSYALALDMTRRDQQGEMKKAGRPREIRKAFERSAPVGPVHSVTDVGHPDHGAITLTENGASRQEGDEMALAIGGLREMTVKTT